MRALIALAVGAAAFTATPTAAPKHKKPDTASEFGDELDLSLAFFREEGRPARDLAVLACSYALESRQKVRVLDACAGAGARTLRYLRDLPSDVEVLANEPNDGTQLEANCRNFKEVTFASGDAGELLARNPRSFDVVDVDSFGLSGDPALAVQAALNGGVVLLATTGAAAAGARGKAAREALKKRLGCDACKTPAQNELGLRMLLGAAARAASKDDAVLRPLFSHYAAHGPVFRVVAVVDRSGDSDARAEQYLVCCRSCGQAAFSPSIQTRCGVCGEDLGEDAVAGPVWAGPLHDFNAIAAMRADAEGRGWVGDRGYGRKLGRLLDTLVDESRDADLDASLFISLDDVARRAGVRTPSVKGLVAALEAGGFRAASTHVEGKAVKTDAPMAACVDAARVADAAGS
jgi:tRNA (guanine26-N2/guanine27-N2)-dimethyltransferase